MKYDKHENDIDQESVLGFPYNFRFSKRKESN
jgi:hypothetical protein